MIERLYSKLDLQLGALSGFLILSVFLSWLFKVQPLFRASYSTLLSGLLCGAFLVIVEIGYVLLVNRAKKPSWIEGYFNKKELGTISIAKALVQSAGEETLIRGFILVPIAASYNFIGSGLIALATSVFISTVIYSSKSSINWFRGIQALILGIIYLASHSMFIVILSRFIGEISLPLASYYKLPTTILKRFFNANRHTI